MNEENIKCGSILILSNDGNKLTLESWSPCILKTTLFTPILLCRCYVNLHINDLRSQACIHLRTDYDGLYPNFTPGIHEILVNIESLNLEEGSYVAYFRLVSEINDIIIDFDNIIFDIKRRYERYVYICATAAVKHVWSFRSKEKNDEEKKPF